MAGDGLGRCQAVAIKDSWGGTDRTDRPSRIQVVPKQFRNPGVSGEMLRPFEATREDDKIKRLFQDLV